MVFLVLALLLTPFTSHCSLVIYVPPSPYFRVDYIRPFYFTGIEKNTEGSSTHFRSPSTSLRASSCLSDTSFRVGWAVATERKKKLLRPKPKLIPPKCNRRTISILRQRMSNVQKCTTEAWLALFSISQRAMNKIVENLESPNIK